MATKTKWLAAKPSAGETIDELVNAFIQENEKQKITTVQYQAVPTAEGIEHYAFITYHTKDEKGTERQAGFIR